jgi:hypothetical protein
MSLIARALLLVPLALACGDHDPALEGVTAPVGSLLPWKPCNRWTYRVTAGGVVTMKVTSIEAAEPVRGGGPHAAVLANRVVTSKSSGRDRTVSWQAVVGSRVSRFREQAFHAETGALELEEHWSPAKLHVSWAPEHVRAGASWLEVYEETKLPAGGTLRTAIARDRWTVLATDQAVTVPAGTFRAVVLQKAGGSNAKTYWYVPGVGKVKEEGGQTEELVSYELAP